MTSPKRRALHERTDSHTNEITSPSLRIVDDSEAHIYTSNPYPTQASHILSPSNGQGLLFGEDEGVSDEITLTKPFASSSPKGRKWKGKRKGKVIAKTTNVSETGSPSTADASPFSPPAPEYSQVTTPASSSPTKQQFPADLGLNLERKLSDEIIQLPSIPEPGIARCRTDLPESPSAAPPLPDIPVPDSIISKPSKVSISSSASTETVARPRHTDRSSRASYSAFPPLDRPSSSRSTRSFSTPVAPPHPIVDRSGGSPSRTSSSYPSVQGRRTSSVPSHADLQAAIKSGANVQYPIVRKPVASGSWADTTISVPKRPSRMSEHNSSRRWNPHLSIVRSDSTGEGSNERYPLPVQEAEPASVTSSMVVEGQLEASGPLAPPRPLFPRNRDGTGSTIRVVDQEDDRTTNLQSRPLRSQASGFLSILSSGSVKRKAQRPSEVRTEPGSRGSFLRDSIPAWARYVTIVATTFMRVMYQECLILNCQKDSLCSLSRCSSRRSWLLDRGQR